MNRFGAPPRLDRVPAIWPSDAGKLMDCGLETVRDLVDHVRIGEGFSALSDGSGIPVEQLRSYFLLAERETFKARARKRGVWGLLAIALLTTVMAFIWAPPTLERPEEKRYADFYQRYQTDSLLVTLAEELDVIVALYDSVINGNEAAAATARAQLDTLVPGAVLAEGTEMSPQLANIVSLRAAMYHDDAISAAAEDSLGKYEDLFQETQKLNSWLGETESHEEYASENSRRAMTERAEVYSISVGPRALDSVQALIDTRSAELKAEFNTRSAEFNTRLVDLETNLESERESLTSSIRLIDETLSDHTEKLDLLIGRPGTNPSGTDETVIDPPPPGPGDFAPIPDEVPTPVNLQEARRVIAAARPRDLEDDRTVVVWVFINEEGSAQDSVPRVETTSGDGQLDSAALSAAREIRFNPPMYRGVPVGMWVSWPITFRGRE